MKDAFFISFIWVMVGLLNCTIIETAYDALDALMPALNLPDMDFPAAIALFILMTTLTGHGIKVEIKQ